MTPELCRELFVTGSEDCDLAVVEGVYDVARPSPSPPAPRPSPPAPSPEAERSDGPSPDALHRSPLPPHASPHGGSLDVLCDWLDLPRLVVLNVSQLAETLPAVPGRIDGVLLDRADSGARLARAAIDVETQWDVPVLGSLGALPELRAQLRTINGGERPGEDVARRLGDQFLRTGEPERVVEIAQQRGAWTDGGAEPAVQPHVCGGGARPCRDALPMADVTVALAYDDALNCYFPDTLDLLELRGATIIDFSPLHDDRLPEAEIVYLGCGHPEAFARALSDNDCMRLALRGHVRRGGRIYAEGGGTAYLCEQLEAADGVLHRMVGVLPAVARLNRQASEPVPVSATLAEGCWLGPPGERVRGYLGDQWRLEPTGRFDSGLVEPEHRHDLIECCQAIGSRIHLDFAAQSHLLPGLLQRSTAGQRYDPWHVT